MIIHSPSEKTVAPSQEETKIPTRNTKTRDVKNPRPARKEEKSKITNE